MSDLIITVGESWQAVIDRAAEAERASNAGEIAEDVPTRINFDSWEDLTRTLTPKRLEVLRYLHRNPTASVRSLAAALERAYSNVHGDVTALIDAGLIERDDDGLHAAYDNIMTKIAL